MIINGRQVVLKPEFDEMLDEMLEWFISQGNEQFAKQFVRGLYNDIVHKIAPPVQKATPNMPGSKRRKDFTGAMFSARNTT